MRTLVFPFTTQDIIITSNDNISDQSWEQISRKVGDLITEILFTLHPTEPDSPISKLHESGVGYPVSANDILWDFLKIAEHYHNVSQGKLNILSGEAALDLIEFEPKEMLISRKQDIRIRPHVIMSEYTAHCIDSVLSKTSLSNYLISAPHSYLVRGTEQWEISFLHPDDESSVDMVVGEGAAVICYPSARKFKQQRQVQQSPFSHNYTATPISAAIVESSNPLYSKVIGEFIFELEAAYQFKQLAQEWDCGATILFADGTLEQYS